MNTSKNWLVEVIREELAERKPPVHPITHKKPSKSQRKRARLLKNRIERDRLVNMPTNAVGALHKQSADRRSKAKEFAATNSFLETYEWRKVRMQAIKMHGARCQCCGATPKDGIRINVDHIKPRRTHPELALSLDNLQVLCDVCNHGKGNWDQTDWRDKL